MADAAAPARIARELELDLLDEFRLRVDGRIVGLPHTAERLLAYLAIARRPVNRLRLAGALWPDVGERIAGASLRRTLWRLRRLTGRLIEVSDDRLALGERTRVDLWDGYAAAGRVRLASSGDPLDDLPLLIDHVELLPDWDDDWLMPDRERFRLARLGALEHATDVLLERDDLGGATETALAAIGTEPLRESARRLLVRCHLAEGNVAEALHVYTQYRSLLRQELGVRPSRAMEALVQPLTTG